MTPKEQDPKEVAREEVKARRGELIDLSHRIHANPEVAFKEEKSSAWVADALQAGGFEVERGVADLPTAFVARAGAGPLNIAICAEYDALPAVGHACGHNIISSAAVGAALALRTVADATGMAVNVFGTPAEEGGGGKVIMLERGVFEGMHAAMMVHPWPFEQAAPPWIAVAHLTLRYLGREAHAAAAPERGINAADALTVAQVAIGLLRQHILATDRIHGIVTKGGDAANIVPAHTEAEFLVRSRTLEELEDTLLPRVLRCFEAGALATGSTLEVHETPRYAQVVSDLEIVAVYQRNAESLGRSFPELTSDQLRSVASTDFGNISLAMPAVQPLIAIETNGAVNHQPEFAAACVSESADQAVIDGAIALAWTAIDLAIDENVRARLMANPARTPQ